MGGCGSSSGYYVVAGWLGAPVRLGSAESSDGGPVLCLCGVGAVLVGTGDDQQAAAWDGRGGESEAELGEIGWVGGVAVESCRNIHNERVSGSLEHGSAGCRACIPKRAWGLVVWTATATRQGLHRWLEGGKPQTFGGRGRRSSGKKCSADGGHGWMDGWKDGLSAQGAATAARPGCVLEMDVVWCLTEARSKDRVPRAWSCVSCACLVPVLCLSCAWFGLPVSIVLLLPPCLSG